MRVQRLEDDVHDLQNEIEQLRENTVSEVRFQGLLDKFEEELL